MNLFESNNESSDRGRNLRATIIDSGQPQRVVRGLKVGISYRKTAICEFSALKEHNLSKSYIRTTTTLKPKSSLILAGFLANLQPCYWLEFMAWNVHRKYAQNEGEDYPDLFRLVVLSFQITSPGQVIHLRVSTQLRASSRA